MCGTVTVTELLSPMSTVAIWDLSTDAGLKSSKVIKTFSIIYATKKGYNLYKSVQN